MGGEFCWKEFFDEQRTILLRCTLKMLPGELCVLFQDHYGFLVGLLILRKIMGNICLTMLATRLDDKSQSLCEIPSQTQGEEDAEKKEDADDEVDEKDEE